MNMRVTDPRGLPPDFWSRGDVRDALTQRNFGALFQVLAKFGWSQTRIAIAVGISQGQVSTVVAGTRKVMVLDVAERTLDGLEAPDEARLRFGLAPRGAVGPAVSRQGIAAELEVVAPLDFDTPGEEGGAVPVESVAEIVERMRRVGQSNVDEVRLSYLERAADAAILSSERQSPADLMPYVRDTRHFVDDLLTGKQHPGQRERLYVTAVKLSGLLGSLALDLGHWKSARAYGMEAFELATFLDKPVLQAWACATQSLIEYYAGNYHDALAFAQHGQQLADGGPQSVRLALNGEARALARLRNADGVADAVERGMAFLDGLPPARGVSPSLSLDVYCRARSAANAATAYLAIRQADKASEYAGAALVAFDAAGLRGPQALSRLDQASALLMGRRPEPEQACAVLADALSRVENERFESVVQRSREFLRSADPWEGLPAVRQARELVRGYGTRPALEGPAAYDRQHAES
jgi:hypothetical protein